MSAIVEPTIWKGRFVVWCQECITGYGGSKRLAQRWADKHNENNHPSEAVPTGAASTITTEET